MIFLGLYRQHRIVREVGILVNFVLGRATFRATESFSLPTREQLCKRLMLINHAQLGLCNYQYVLSSLLQLLLPTLLLTQMRVF